MATTIQRDERTFRQASFRHVASGAVVNTGAFHDIAHLPGGEEADVETWEAGFTDGDGRFYTRAEAALWIGLRGRLESKSYFAGEANPTLEAGGVESWRAPTFRRAA